MDSNEISLKVRTYIGSELDTVDELTLSKKDDGNYKIIRIPSKAFGLTYGDSIQVGANTSELVVRGGFVGTRIYGRKMMSEKELNEAIQVIKSKGAVYEVFINRSERFLLLIAFPLDVGWSFIENFCTSYFDECKWEYSNVYDENGEFLEWWKGKESNLQLTHC